MAKTGGRRKSGDGRRRSNEGGEGGDPGRKAANKEAPVKRGGDRGAPDAAMAKHRVKGGPKDKGGRGGGRGGAAKGKAAGRGGKKSNPKKNTQAKPKPVTADDLDADMENYWLKSGSKELAQKKLDEEMDSYWAKKGAEDSKGDGSYDEKPAADGGKE